MDPVWFRRFADIPGVRYPTPPDVDVSRLQQRDYAPTIHRFEGLEPSLFWETLEGGTSRAPAGEHAFGDFGQLNVAGLLRNIAEVLELPGEPSDYHFALQSTAGELNRRRRDEPRVLDDVERLYLLDLQLIQACPFAVTWEHDSQTSYFQISAFSWLLSVYLTEGRVADAVVVADIAERFDAGALPVVIAARERAAALAAEDMP